METGRVEAFSDGVFAIAITLLILAVGVDQARASGSFSHQLLHLWPAYIAYAVSFVTVGIMWINHHMIFRHFASVDRILLLLNIFLLMLIAFTPFPTRVVAEFAHTDTDRRAAALLYGINMTMTAILFFAVWMYGSRRGLPGHTPASEARDRRERTAEGGVPRVDRRAYVVVRVVEAALKRADLDVVGAAQPGQLGNDGGRDADPAGSRPQRGADAVRED